MGPSLSMNFSLSKPNSACFIWWQSRELSYTLEPAIRTTPTTRGWGFVSCELRGMDDSRGNFSYNRITWVGWKITCFRFWSNSTRIWTFQCEAIFPVAPVGWFNLTHSLNCPGILVLAIYFSLVPCFFSRYDFFYLFPTVHWPTTVSYTLTLHHDDRYCTPRDTR